MIGKTEVQQAERRLRDHVIVSTSISQSSIVNNLSRLQRTSGFVEDGRKGCLQRLYHHGPLILCVTLRGWLGDGYGSLRGCLDKGSPEGRRTQEPSGV